MDDEELLKLPSVNEMLHAWHLTVQAFGDTAFVPGTENDPVPTLTPKADEFYQTLLANWGAFK